LKVTRAADKFHIHLGAREKRMIFELFSLYPRIPPAHQRLSKSGTIPDPQANQKLLDEALAEHRAESKRQLNALVTDPKHLTEIKGGWRLELSRAELETLLQALNDIRVGSWLLLGSPDPNLNPAMITEETGPDYMAMELAGYFQMRLIEHLNGGL
jgi:hypothetical protein